MSVAVSGFGAEWLLGGNVLCNILMVCYRCFWYITLTSGLIQAVRKKQLICTWLCVGISLLLNWLRTWSKRQKTRQSL